MIQDVLSCRMKRLIDDAGGVVDDEPVKEAAAVWRGRQWELVRSKAADPRRGLETSLEREPAIVAYRRPVHRRVRGVIAPLATK